MGLANWSTIWCACRVVDHHHEVGQAGPLDRQHRLGEHEHRQDDQRDPQRGERRLRGQGDLAFAAVKPDDQRGAAEYDQEGNPLRPGLFEADLRRDRLAGAAGSTPI